MTALNNLLFRVSLLDSMSGPARTMMNNMDRVTSRIQGGFNKIGYGAAGLAGAAYSLDSILQPAKEMNTALGEISSLGVGQQVLDNLRNTAMDFSSQYGESAAEFVHASYDIQSAISGLAGNELAAFTNASSILAKGTKADMGVITDYVGTMYGVFKDSADGMGKSKWVEQLAGQTALAVNIFKSTGQGMSEAFSGLAGASSAPMAEQLGVLGQLQAVKHGSEAGTLYKTFLAGVGKSQKELGLNFTDTNGKLLPMVDILTKITGKFGSLEKQSTRDLLTKALGGTEAMSVVDILSKDIGGLNANIAQIDKQKGLQGAIEMAKAMTMPWDRAKESVTNLRIALGDKMLVAMTPLYNKITEVSETLRRWTGLFPNIARYIGYAAFTVIGITAALSALSIIVGIGTLVMGGFGLVLAVITSPITLAVLGIVALGAAIGAAIYKWDEWGGAIMYVGKAITDAFGVTWLLQLFWDGLTGIYNGWSMIFSIVSDNAGSILSFIGDIVSTMLGIEESLFRALGLGPVIDMVKTFFGAIVDGWKMIGQLVLPDWMQKLIPGMSASVSVATPTAITGPQTAAPSLSAMASQPQWLQQPAPGLLSDGFAPPQPIAPPAALSQSQTANVPKGGLMSQINNADNSKSVSVGGITVNNYGQPVTGQRLADEIAMAAG